MAKKKTTPEEVEPAVASAGENYTVLARRYRPQQFTDLVGQEAVVQAITNAIQSNRVAHAYLFTGARGVGKTSMARILAKALNCVNGPTATPCDQCGVCRGIASGEDIDVLEIDGASNNRIDEVREIRQNVQYRPSRARYKIYIIDEVHMLTTQAFNALLKTLEEPPEHVKFIFATTEVQKIPITILSRCQRFDFSGIGTSRIVDRLREVVQAEKMEAEDEALELVARRAGGSMRDAQSLLDQLLAFGGDRLTADQVHQMLGTAHIDRVIEIASAVLENDATQALELLGRAADQGLQLGEFVDQLMDYWRDLMVAHCAGKDFKHLNIPSRHKEALAKQAAKLKLDTILAGLDILSSAKTRLRGIGQARVLLEMTVVRLSRLDDLVSITQLAQLVSQSAGNQSVSGREAGQQQTLGAALANSRAAGQNIGTASSGAADSLKKKLTDSDGGAVTSNFIRVSEESLPSLWQETLKQVGPMLAGALEKSGLPAIFAPNTLVIRFPPDYNSGREHCQNPASVTRIEDVLRKLTGHPVSVRFEVGKSDSATPVTSAPAEEGQDSQSRYRRVRAEAMKEPFIKRAMEVLGAQLVDVEEGFGGSTAATAERNETTDSEES